ncbi:MAG: hypothetical protein KA807_09615 [Prolixibacteraceae bacterium]|nr:hypothetical protein [Prolixibacteraceae bacterium]
MGEPLFLLKLFCLSKKVTKKDSHNDASTRSNKNLKISKSSAFVPKAKAYYAPFAIFYVFIIHASAGSPL